MCFLRKQNICCVIKSMTLRWRHNGDGSVSNHQPPECLLNRFSGADQSKHQSSASLAFVWGIHRGPVNSPHKWPVTRKMFPFDDVFMKIEAAVFHSHNPLLAELVIHQMESFSALLAFCAGNSPVTGEFPAQRPVTRSFDVSFDLRSNKRLSRQSRRRWF